MTPAYVPVLLALLAVGVASMWLCYRLDARRVV